MGVPLCFFFFALTVFVIGATSTPPRAQLPLRHATSSKPYLDEAFDDYVKDVLGYWKVPGLSIAVVDGDDVYSKGYGFSTLPDEEATPDTQYFTGSTTKAFVAAAIAQLVHNETHYPDVSWTSPINQFLRADFVIEDEHATTHTTIEDALSHRSGLPRHDFIYGVPGDTPTSVVERMRYLPMTAEPRTTFQYCNLMYVVMTDFLETVTGIDLENLLRDRFWSPLGMLSTSFTLPSAQYKLARGYFWDSSVKENDPPNSEGRYVAEPFLDLLPISGAGATISTVNDYALWIKALLSAADPHSPTNASSPITQAMFLDLVTPRSIILNLEGQDPWYFASPALYALGWYTIKAADEIIVIHQGGLTGFGTAVYLVPNQRFGIAMMGNTAATSNVAESVLASVLLRRKLKSAGVLAGTERNSAEMMKFEETLLGISHDVPLLGAVKERQSRGYQSHKQTPHTVSLPLPGDIEDFAGLYSHPAYGVFNFTVTNSNTNGEASKKILQAIVAPRTWPRKLELRHTTDTVFALEVSSPHGLGDIRSEDIVWELESHDGQAVFKFGLDGETVETMGIELEPSMVEMARARGTKAWKEGMMWFEKV